VITLVTDDERARLAREALCEITAEATIGELVDQRDEGEGVTTLSFAATMPGYPGWHWTVSVAELPDEAPSVLEVELLPGDGALLAPDWVPWSERLDDYRAAQAAAAEAAAEAEGDDAEADGDDDLDDDGLDDDDDDDDLDLDDLDSDDELDEHDIDDDFGDDPDDGIDFEHDATISDETTSEEE
jgi:hypothetical protein